MLNEKKYFVIVTERRAFDFSRFKPILNLIKKDKEFDYQVTLSQVYI